MSWLVVISFHQADSSVKVSGAENYYCGTVGIHLSAYKRKTHHIIIYLPTLRYPINEQDLLSKQGVIFSEVYDLRAGWIFSFIAWKFASRADKCSEIVKHTCSCNRYLKVHTKLSLSRSVLWPGGTGECGWGQLQTSLLVSHVVSLEMSGYNPFYHTVGPCIPRF